MARALFVIYNAMGGFNKESLRKIYKAKRVSLTVEQKAELDAQLLTQFQQFVWQGLEYVHIFLPIAKFNEPDTYSMADWLREVYPEIKLVISKSDLKNNLMEHVLWDKDQILEINPWGINEPVEGKIIAPQQLDAVIIPLLAFDKKGHRVGYGKGFYDRFLAACRPDCLFIGLSFYCPVEEIEDAGTMDIPLDFCITTERIWKINT